MISFFASMNLSGQLRERKVWPPARFNLNLDTTRLEYNSDHVKQLESYGFNQVPSTINLLEYAHLYIHEYDVPLLQDRFLHAVENRNDLSYYDRFEFRIKSPLYGDIMLLVNIWINEEHHVSGMSQDVSDLKVDTYSFLYSEANFKAVIENTVDYVFTADLKGQLVIYNRSFKENILKYFNLDLNTGFKLENLLPENLRIDWLYVYEKGLKGFAVNEELYIDLDRRYFYDVSVNPIHGFDNEVFGVSFWVKDITRKKVAISIESLESRILNYALNEGDLKPVMDSLLKGVELIYPHLYCYCIYYNFNENKLEKLSHPRLPEDCVVFLTEKTELIDGNVYSEESVKENKLKTSYALPVLNPNGEVVGTIGAYLKENRSFLNDEINIIERMVQIAGILIDRSLASESSKTKAKQIEEISNSIDGIIYESVTKPGGTGQFTYLSERTRDIIGIDINELPYDFERLFNFIHKDDRDQSRLSWENSIKHLTNWYQEFRLLNHITSKYDWYRVNTVHHLKADKSIISHGTIIKINDLKEKEEKAEESHLRLTAIVESIDELFFELDAQGYIIELWSGTEEFNRNNAVLSQSLSDLFDQGFLNCFLSSIPDIKNNNKQVDYIYRTFIDNELRIYSCKTGKISNSAEDLYYLTCRNITESHRSEEYTSKLENIIRNAGTFAKIGAWEFNIENNELQWADEVYSIFELSRDLKKENLLSAFFSSVVPEDLIELSEKITNASVNGVPYEIEHRIMLPDKRMKWVHCNADVLKNDLGKPVRLFGLIQDITERKNREEENNTLSLVARRTSNAVIITNAEGITQWVNESFENMTGYTLNEMKGQKPDFILQGATPSTDLESLMQQAVSAQKGVEVEILNYHKNGNPYWMHIEIQPVFNKHGLLSNFIAIHTDITERVNSEKLIRESLKEKEILLAEIHHRVKNNLAIISSLLHLQELYSEDTNANRILQESQGRIRSMALVHEKLYNSGAFSSIDFDRYIRDIVEYISVTFSKPELKVQINFDITESRMEITSAVPCGLIINEAVTNIYKHAFVEAVEGKVGIIFRREDDLYRLEIADNGVGIRQESDYNKKESLGLTLIHTLTKQLKGQLSVNAYDNSGTTVLITFPVQKQS